MTKKILVTTDFSDASKAGLHFAIQLASQHPFDLYFFHCYHLDGFASASETETNLSNKSEGKKAQEKLERFVAKIYKGLDEVMPLGKCIVHPSVIVQSNIMEYAAVNRFDFICISTRGAGKLDRFFGTNTANIINQSKVPVIAVPHKCRSHKIKKILYASDMVNLDPELEKVISFAKPINATVEILHFAFPLEDLLEASVAGRIAKKLGKMDIKVNLELLDPVRSLVSNIESEVKKRRPSMMIMFTEQHRSFFQKLIFAGNSASYAYNPKVPLLVFNKPT